MHERSLMRSLLNAVEELRIENNAVAVDVITVELGPLSGVESELIQSAFDEMAPVQFESVPELIIRNVNLLVRCRQCREESAIAAMTFRCPRCSSTQVQVIRGDEFRLIDVSMQVPATTSESNS